MEKALSGKEEKKWMKNPGIKIDDKGYVAKGVFFFPAEWPGFDRGRIQPGALDLFIHYDAAFDIYQPTWGVNCEDVMKRHHLSHALGAVAYFDPEDCGYIGNLLDFFRIDQDMREYAAFVGDSHDPKKAGFIRQVRIVSKEALKTIFGMKAIRIDGGDPIPLDEFAIAQNVNLEDLILLFVASEERRFADKSKLDNLFSDNREAVKNLEKSLVFGLMIEDKRCPVLRIWSMAELAYPPKS